MCLQARVIRCVTRGKGMRIPRATKWMNEPIGSVVRQWQFAKYKRARKNARSSW